MAKFLSELHDTKDQALLLSLCPFTKYNLQVVFSGCRKSRSNFSRQSKSPHFFTSVDIHSFIVNRRNLAEIVGNSCPGNGKRESWWKERHFQLEPHRNINVAKVIVQNLSKAEARVLACILGGARAAHRKIELP